MKPKQKLIYLVFVLCLSGPASFSQDIHFSQIFETPMLRNPALAGIFAGDIRIQSVYRSQWNSVTDAYQTISLDGEYKVPVGNHDDYLTVGAEILYDRAGTVALTATHVLPALNFHKSLAADRNTYLSLAFMGGLVQRSIDRTKITTNNQYSGVSFDGTASNGESFPNNSYHYLDGSAGLSFNTQLGENEDNNMYIGFAYHHLNRPKNISFYSEAIEMKPRMVASGGIRMSVTENSFFTIQADYSKQDTYTETIGGFLYSWKLGDYDDPKYVLHMGTYFRVKDAMIPVFKVEAKPLAVAVSYDANISQLKTASQGRGGFELSVSWQKYLNRYLSSSDATRCPKF